MDHIPFSVSCLDLFTNNGHSLQLRRQNNKVGFELVKGDYKKETDCRYMEYQTFMVFLQQIVYLHKDIFSLLKTGYIET